MAIKMTRAEYQAKYGAAPALQTAAPVEAPKQKNDLLNNPVTRGIQTIFPGQKVGQAIGTLGGYLASPNKKYYDTSAPSPLQVGGDIAQGALTVAAPNIGNGATALGRIGANAALGTGLGATGAVAQGQGLGGVAKEAAIGGAIGGGASAVGEVGKYLTENMPKWFTRLALPKLSNSKINGAPEDVVNYALNNSKGATLKSMYGNSSSAIKSYENQIQSTLAHPNYATETGSKNIIEDVVSGFGNAQLTPEQVVSYAKNVAPAEKALVDKVAKGTANLAEKNQLRKVLDMATKARFTDSPKLTFAKQIGGAFADALRSDVQGTAAETAPIFKEYAKEIALNKALGNALSKKRVAGPLVAGAGGFAGGGIKGALGAIAIEEGLRSPTVGLAAAKTIKGLGKVALPVGKALLQGGKAPLIKAATNQQETTPAPQVGPITLNKNVSKIGNAVGTLLPGVKAGVQSINEGTTAPYKKFLSDSNDRLKTPKGLADAATGFGSAVAGTVEKRVLQSLTERDAGIMEKGISYLRNPHETQFEIPDHTWNGVERLARKLKINMNQPFAKIANQFENILSRLKK